MPMFNQLHRTAVLTTVDLVDTITPDDLPLTTPCEGWTLGDLLAHMTVQHQGFAAAARGDGADPLVWRVQNVADAVAADPAGAYSAAAHDVLEAFAADGTDEAAFALPEFGPGAVVPGATAKSFHFVDYVVHGWDVAATLGVPFSPPDDVIEAVLPIALAVPDGEFRLADGSPFAPAVDAAGTDDFDRVLRHLGRRPDWALPSLR